MKIEIGKRYLNDCNWHECEVEGKRGFMILYFYIDERAELAIWVTKKSKPKSLYTPSGNVCLR